MARYRSQSEDPPPAVITGPPVFRPLMRPTSSPRHGPDATVAEEPTTDPLELRSLVESALPATTPPRETPIPSNVIVETTDADGWPIKPHYPGHRLFFVTGGCLTAVLLAAWFIGLNPITSTGFYVFVSLTVLSGLLDFVSNRNPAERRVQLDGEDRSVTVSILKEREARRFLRKKWTRTIQTLQLADSYLVDTRLAAKCPIEPVDSETRIDVLRRLNWWSHGPLQLAIGIAGVLGVAGLFQLRYLPVFEQALVGWILATAVCYYLVWMKWAYGYIVVTDRRVLFIYRPPWQLPGEPKRVWIDTIITYNSPDQGVFGNVFGFGTVKCDTTVEKGDAWLSETGIKYVTGHRDVSRIIENNKRQSVGPSGS